MLYKINKISKRKYYDLSGLKFGKLTPLDPIFDKKSIYWNCLCDCGNYKKILAGELLRTKRKGTQSCGCIASPNLKGLKFGKLTVIERFDKKWKCVCDCGNIIFTSAYLLNKKQTTSCGCFRKLRVKEANSYSLKEECVLSSAREVFLQYKLSKKYKDLSFKDFFKKSQMACFYCGKFGYNTYNVFISRAKNIKKYASEFSKKNGDFIYNGLDRIDNCIGYTENNTVPCCRICNFFKSDRKITDFLNNLNCLKTNIVYTDVDHVIHHNEFLSKKIISLKVIVDKIFNNNDKYKTSILLTKIYNCKKLAKKRKINYQLSMIETMAYCISDCTYCGNKCNFDTKNINGIDRINNNINYNKSNCTSCCKYCNYAKNNLDIDNFKEWINNIHSYKIRREENIKLRNIICT